MPIYLKPEELIDSYNEADRVAQDWFKPFDEYERIAGNKISKTLAANMPRVNDGSLAASLIETPMNVLPFMQPGKFKSTDKTKPWLGELANIIWKTKIVPNANTQAPYFDKEQMALYRALKYGAQPRYNFYVSTPEYTGCDWSLPYIRNIKLEPGKFSEVDCDYIFMDVYYTKLQLQNLIESQKEEKKQAKAEGRKADTSWNIEALETLVGLAKTQKEMEDQNINEREKQVHSSGIKTTVCFNRGVDAPFYMFSKHLPEGELLREWKNPDPTGAIPITMQYCFENLESPYGIGRIELAGPTQNVLDYMTQAHILATQLGLQPVTIAKGALDTANMNTIVHAPNAVWQTGQADFSIQNNTNPVYTQFPNSFGLYKTQLQTLQGRTDGSVSATSGNPTFSKTSAGVNQQESRTNAQDNYLRNKADSASARMAEKMMNIHMNMMQGADILDIAEEDRARLESAGFFDNDPDTGIPSITEIPIMYDELRSTFKFEYDPRPETDENEKARYLEALDIITSNPNVVPMAQQDGYLLHIGEVLKKIFVASGADNVDKIITKMEAESMSGGEVDPATGQPIQEEPQDQDELSMTMDAYNVDENMAMAIMEARQQGFSEQEIEQFVVGGGI